MKVQFKVSRRMTVEAEADSVKELYAQIHNLSETFGVATCGLCGGEDVRYIARKNTKFTFYEVVCQDRDCRGKLAMGVKDDGSIYPRRKAHDDHPDVKAGKIESGAWLPDGGWSRWTPEAKKS